MGWRYEWVAALDADVYQEMVAWLTEEAAAADDDD